ncbi:MAG: dCTP deaminase [Candidatus Micrarchaeia archaeon]
MIMSNIEIEKAIRNGEIILQGFESENLGPDSIDIRLGNKLLIAKKTGKIVDPRVEIGMEFDEIYLDDGPYAIKPGDFVLGSTYEKIGLSRNITAQLEGRSSIGRLGIVVHMTAGLVHAGWGYKQPSTLTLEISSVNPNPVYLYNKMKIAQISFMRHGTPPEHGYDDNRNNKYSGQKGPLPSMIHKDFQ